MSRDNTTWNRLSPVSIIFFIGKTLKHFLKDSVTGLAPLAVILFNSDNPVWLVSLIIIAAIGLFLSNAVLQYIFFRYQVQQDKILVHEGVFKKKQRIISYQRVQNINILQPFYFKPFSLVTLQLETAGSKTNEVNLAGIKFEQAESTKYMILRLRAESTPEAEVNDTQADEVLARASTSDLVKYGLTSNGMFWFFVFMAPLFGVLDDIIENKIIQENWQLLDRFYAGEALFVLFSLVSLLLIMIGFSILGAIFRYHNYRLTIHEETLKRYGGLLSTHEESAKLPKIQAFVNKTNFIGHWLKVENVFLKQASTQQNNPNASNKLFVIPTQTRDKTNKLLSRFFDLAHLQQDLLKVNRRYILKTWSIIMLFVLVISLFIGILTNDFRALILLAIGIPLWPLINLRWKNFGYVINDHFASFRRGLFGFKRITFPLFKVQRVAIAQSPLQQRKNLATLKIYLASERVTIPYIPMEHAQLWFDRISYQIETTEQNWF